MQEQRGNMQNSSMEKTLVFSIEHLSFCTTVMTSWAVMQCFTWHDRLIFLLELVQVFIWDSSIIQLCACLTGGVLTLIDGADVDSLSYRNYNAL
jgi:hypothetical protein